MDKLVLFLQIDRLTCYQLESGGASVARQWPIAAAELPGDLSVFLENNSHAEFSLLIDTPEEECHLESFKTNSIRDRSHLINRIRNKHFKNALLSKASVIGKGDSASLLLSGVASDELCAGLVRLLEQSRASVRAVHSPLTLMSAIAKATHASKGACLFVLPMRGCYRLIACVNSFVLFNRRIVIPNGSGNESAVNSIPASVGTELTDMLTDSLTETLVYLQRQQVVGWETPGLIVAGTHDSSKMLAGVCKKVVESGLAKPGAGSEDSDYSSTVQRRSTSTDVLLVTAAGHCGNGYTTRELRRAYTTRKVRNVCAALALCGVGGVVSSVAVANKLTDLHATIINSYHESSVLKPVQAQSNVPEDHYQVVAEAGAASGNEVEAVRQALVTAKLIELGSVHRPIEFLGELAQQASQQQSVSVTSVKWQTDDILNTDSLLDMIARPEAIKTLPVEQVYQATVSGIVQGKPDQALHSFDLFVSALRSASSDPSVVVVETPFGLGAGDKTTDSLLSGARGDFVLELSARGVAR